MEGKRRRNDGSVTDEAEEDGSNREPLRPWMIKNKENRSEMLKHQKKLEKRGKAKAYGAAVMRGEILPDELISEVLSLLDVKSLMRMKCVSKSWNSLISDDPTFIKMHLKKSARNKHLALVTGFLGDSIVVPFSVCCLLQNPSIPVTNYPRHRLKEKDCDEVIGCCNGLLCLLGYSFRETWLRFWNPATRTISEKLGSLHRHCNFKFAFGYDNSTDTYKVVAFRPGKSKAKVFSLVDNVWKDIQSFPVIPLRYNFWERNDGVYLSGTINWLAIHNKFTYDWEDITVKQFVIISLDLGTETYTQLLPPQGFDEVPPVEPSVVVLMDCLCFSHDFKGTHFVIWQMTEFGVERSWTLFLKISYQNPAMGDHFQLLPLLLSETSDTLILVNENVAILYNWRDSRVVTLGARHNNIISWLLAKDYVESLVPTC